MSSQITNFEENKNDVTNNVTNDVKNKPDLLIKTNKENKIINTVCHCGTALQWKRTEVIMLNPCEHLIHKECFKSLGTKCCPFCNNCVQTITRLDYYKCDPNVFQKCVDILSMTNIDDMMKISYDDALFNIPEILAIISKGMLGTGFKTGWELARDTLKNAGVKIKVSGLEKIKDGPKVFIANHTCHLDALCILYLIKTSFVATGTIKDNFFTNRIRDVIPMHTIDLGKSKNAVEGMREHVEKFGSVCIFPEGMFTHPATLARFRTGAFYIGYPVYPIVLKYKNYMGDTSLLDFVLKTHSENSEYVEFTVMDPFYPPFNDDKIELVRFAMAECGNLLLARTSNRDVDNTKKKKKIKGKGSF